jgi:hypothetical protein
MDNIKIFLGDTWWNHMDWISLTQIIDQQRALFGAQQYNFGLHTLFCFSLSRQAQLASSQDGPV